MSEPTERNGEERAEVKDTPDPNRKLFRVTARNIGLPKEWTSGSVSELLEMLEGPGYR